MNKETAIRFLKLKEGYSKQDVMTSYRKLAKVYHPDSPTGSQDYFQILTESKELLISSKDSEKESKSKTEVKSENLVKKWNVLNKNKEKPRYVAKKTLLNIVDLGK